MYYFQRKQPRTLYEHLFREAISPTTHEPFPRVRCKPHGVLPGQSGGSGGATYVTVSRHGLPPGHSDQNPVSYFKRQATSGEGGVRAAAAEATNLSGVLLASPDLGEMSDFRGITDLREIAK